MHLLTFAAGQEPYISFDFSRRADLTRHPELMDQPCSYEDLRDCLRSIAHINRLTMAYRPTLQWLDQLCRSRAVGHGPLRIVDVGCGYGDVLRHIHGWAAQRRIPVTLMGIDLNADAVRAAREATPAGVATFHVGNAFAFEPEGGMDVVVSSLLTHHLEDAAIVEFVRWMEATAKLGWFVNDLHRQPVPYHLFCLWRRFTTWHRFAKYDGAVSILRSFRREDWAALLAAGSIPADAYRVEEYRPARLCVSRVR